MKKMGLTAKNLSLDMDTVKQMEKQAAEMKVSCSALVRILVSRNAKGAIK